MTKPKLIKDTTKIAMDKTRHYGITSPDNITDEALAYYSKAHSYNAQYVLDALLAMKHLQGSLDDVVIAIPLVSYPLMIGTDETAYLIAPLSRGNSNYA